MIELEIKSLANVLGFLVEMKYVLLRPMKDCNKVLLSYPHVYREGVGTAEFIFLDPVGEYMGAPTTHKLLLTDYALIMQQAERTNGVVTILDESGKSQINGIDTPILIPEEKEVPYIPYEDADFTEHSSGLFSYKDRFVKVDIPVIGLSRALYLQVAEAGNLTMVDQLMEACMKVNILSSLHIKPGDSYIEKQTGQETLAARTPPVMPVLPSMPTRPADRKVRKRRWKPLPENLLAPAKKGKDEEAVEKELLKYGEKLTREQEAFRMGEINDPGIEIPESLLHAGELIDSKKSTDPDNLNLPDNFDYEWAEVIKHMTDFISKLAKNMYERGRKDQMDHYTAEELFTMAKERVYDGTRQTNRPGPPDNNTGD